MAGIEQEHRYPCESCGADLRFAPGQATLVCDHCGHAQAIPAATGRGAAVGLEELDLSAGLRADLPLGSLEDVRTLSCPNCAALIEFKGAEHATECPFCATPVVVDTGAARMIRPQALAPFKLTEEQARAALGRWLGRLWFAPGGVQQYARRGRRLTGVYSPFWTFDADTRSAYTGQRGDAYYETEWVTVTRNGKTERQQRRVRHIRWSNARGRVARVFDDVLVLAARSLPRKHTDALKPWELGELVPYTPDFLAGFTAEGYTVQLEEGHAIARAEMANVIASDVRRDIGGDEQRIDSIDTDWSAETFKHILLPVWTAAYKYRGRSFRFVVNGQTGKVQGERPWSWVKITFAVIVVAVIVGVAVYFGQQAQ
ncbi:MAG: primosomal protein N' (replication factor Y) - superfamily II helicase [Alphaproteobacteria bacterium HGW-Alphaproteobacteria-4]|jgi:predicted RNA-binding Zn-ribbon protein involved in translation (DUF1610 family)|nr:MAG: primosomal protein N' (replication factor Y) - superfamily II helicase [Alphaproteobacteria bacterium HGW-Alphaproteobacteria-4]